MVQILEYFDANLAFEWQDRDTHLSKVGYLHFELSFRIYASLVEEGDTLMIANWLRASSCHYYSICQKLNDNVGKFIV